MNNEVFVAAVINRGTWKSDNSMVGHENIIEVAVSVKQRLPQFHHSLPHTAGLQPARLLARPKRRI